jgi:putative hydrolase of the HAD superfamily
MTTRSGSFDAVLFDVGGVLLTNGWDHNERASVLATLGLDAEAKAEFERRHPEPYDAWERDAITPDAYLDATLFYKPQPFTRDDFWTAAKAVSVPIPDSALTVLTDLAASGKWLVGLLNNESRLLHEYRMNKYDLTGKLDVQLSSCYLGLRKPEPAIYRRALDILGCPAARVVFIDDRANNTAAAAAEGITAIQFLGEKSLRQKLNEIGIL